MPKEKTLKIDKQTIIIICASVLLVIGSLVWNTKKNFETEKSAERWKQIQIDSCLDGVYKRYRYNWVDFCKINNYPVFKDTDGIENCDIPSKVADEFTRQHQREKEMCIERY